VAGISHYNVDVTLATGEGKGITKVDHTLVAGTGTQELTIRDSELTLTTSSTQICSGYIIPATDTDLFDKLSLVIEYDIYDKRGNKIAVRTAKNSLAKPLDKLERGEERTLQITIDPSYLYDLSQYDNPDVIIN